MNKLTRDQISRHLAKLKPYKAPGPDGIPNIVLTKCADLCLDRLYNIYNAMIKHAYSTNPGRSSIPSYSGSQANPSTMSQRHTAQ
jgi:hypothetical protein